MLVFSVCFCSGRGKESCAFFSICVTIAIAILGGFGNFRRFTFGFLYQTWGFDPFHNRFVGKKMWGSPTQKRIRKKKKPQLERLDIYIFTKSYNVRLIHKYDWTWRVMMTKQSKKMSTKSGNKKNNTGNETRKGLKLRFTIDSPHPTNLCKGCPGVLSWEHLSKKTNAHSNLWQKPPGAATVLRSSSRSKSWWLAHTFGCRSLAL